MNNTIKADYKNMEKEVMNLISERSKVKSKIEKEVTDKRESVKRATEMKEKMAVEGTQEEYLKACETLELEKKALAFIEERQGFQKKTYKFNPEKLKAIKGNIRREQDRVTLNCLKEVKAQAEALKALCQDTLNEQGKGASLYEKLLNVYKEDCSPAEIENFGSLSASNYTNSYGFNYVSQVIIELDRFLKFVNQKQNV